MRLAFERVHADAHAIGGEAIEDRVGDHGVQPALARHGRDTAGERFGGGELPCAIGAGERVLVDPVLVGPGQLAGPVVDDVGESNRRWTAHVRHGFLAPGTPTQSRRRSRARCRATRTTVPVTPSSAAISGDVFSA